MTKRTKGSAAPKVRTCKHGLRRCTAPECVAVVDARRAAMVAHSAELEAEAGAILADVARGIPIENAILRNLFKGGK